MVGYSSLRIQVPLCKVKLKKRPHPPDTYYYLHHINFEILGTQRQAARIAKGLVISILSLSVSIQKDNLQW